MDEIYLFEIPRASKVSNDECFEYNDHLRATQNRELLIFLASSEESVGHCCVRVAAGRKSWGKARPGISVWVALRRPRLTGRSRHGYFIRIETILVWFD